MDNWQLNTPILFLIFNRPDTTAQVFDTIRQAKPPRLYVAADGPRPVKPEEAKKTAQTRQLVLENIDWDCDVKTLLRESNLGCRQAVTGAIDWFFAHEEEGIILEDDCVPHPSFFRFCEELLMYYCDDKRVMAISGNNFQRGQKRNNYSYYFSQLNHIWGWASWKRAWRLNQNAIAHFQAIRTDPAYLTLTHNKLANRMWADKFVRTYNGEIDTWDYLWTFTNFVNNGVTILPNVNLVSNIGFGQYATHTTNKTAFHLTPVEEINFPLLHPPYLMINRIADDFTYLYHFNCVPMSKKISRKLMRISRQIITHLMKRG